MISTVTVRGDSVRHVARAVPKAHWIPVFLAVGLLTWAIAEQQPAFESRHLYIRVAFLFAAVGASFSFDDPSRTSTESVPSPLFRRRILRVTLGLVPWIICTVSLLWGASQGTHLTWSPSAEPLGAEMPVGRLVLEGGTMAIVGLGITSVLAKRLDDEPGKYAAPALLILFASLWMIPDGWKPFAVPTDLRWAGANGWWVVGLLVAMLATVLFSWDSRRQT